MSRGAAEALARADREGFVAAVLSGTSISDRMLQVIAKILRHLEGREAARWVPSQETTAHGARGPPGQGELNLGSVRRGAPGSGVRRQRLRHRCCALRETRRGVRIVRSAIDRRSRFSRSAQAADVASGGYTGFGRGFETTILFRPYRKKTWRTARRQSVRDKGIAGPRGAIEKQWRMSCKRF